MWSRAFVALAKQSMHIEIIYLYVSGWFLVLNNDLHVACRSRLLLSCLDLRVLEARERKVNTFHPQYSISINSRLY